MEDVERTLVESYAYLRQLLTTYNNISWKIGRRIGQR